MSVELDLYQQVILEHNRKPRNFLKLETATHQAEGFNPLCGDHVWVYLDVSEDGTIQKVTFEGSGCAICKASASMMTQSLVGKSMTEAQKLFKDFKELLTGDLPDDQIQSLGKLKIFSGIWQYPSRVKCAVLPWHTMSGALCQISSITTE